MASYYGVDFSPSLCIRLEIAACWEMIQKQKSQPCPRVGRWMAGCGNDWLIFIHSLQKSERCFSVIPLQLTGPQCFWGFPGSQTLIQGFRFPRASLDLETKISTAALHSSITENPVCAPAQYRHLEPGSWEGWAPVGKWWLWEGVWCARPPALGVTPVFVFL